MKKFKMLWNILSTCSLVIVPVVLLALGIYLNTGTLWDVLCGVGIVAVLALAFKAWKEYRSGDKTAKPRFAVFATLVAFFLLVAQTLFCHLTGGQTLIVEATMTWGFLLACFGLAEAWKNDRPTGITAWTLGFICTFPIGITLFGTLDIVKYFTGWAIPERLGNAMGMTFGICAIAGVVSFLLAIISNAVRPNN